MKVMVILSVIVVIKMTIYRLINAIVDCNNKLQGLDDKEETAFVKSQIEYLNKLLNEYLKGE